MEIRVTCILFYGKKMELEGKTSRLFHHWDGRKFPKLECYHCLSTSANSELIHYDNSVTRSKLVRQFTSTERGGWLRR